MLLSRTATMFCYGPSFSVNTHPWKIAFPSEAKARHPHCLLWPRWCLCGAKKEHTRCQGWCQRQSLQLPRRWTSEHSGEYLNYSNWCGKPILMLAEPFGLCAIESVNWELAHNHHCLLLVCRCDVTAVSSSCFCDFPAWWTTAWNCELNQTFLL